MLELTKQLLGTKEANCELVYREVFRMIKCSRSEFKKCNPEEAEKYMLLQPIERELFKYLVVDFINIEKNLNRLKQKISKLNADRKADLNRLNKVEKENNRNVKIIHNIKSGWSFKIGRFLTWLPRKVLGKK